MVLAMKQLPGGWLKAVSATRMGRGRKEGRGANLNKIKVRRKASGRVLGLGQDSPGERGRRNGAGPETELRSWPRSSWALWGLYRWVFMPSTELWPETEDAD